MQDYWPTWALMFLYLFAVHFGKKFMANREPRSRCGGRSSFTMPPYCSTAHISAATATCASTWTTLRIPTKCAIAKALWWYYFSKCIEFMDTIFFVLRKKNHLISFLHVYHHATMFPLWWIGVKWVAGGQSFVGAMINSFVHVVMYTYYGLCAVGESVQKYLWCGRYLTRMQLIQFFIGMVMGSHSLLTGCGAVPIWMEYGAMFYGMSMIVLFANFYYQEYVSRTNANKKKPAVNGASNGFAASHHHSNGKKTD
uniref:Elongation of very long chain fatty acids protein n=1 Tax=Macrostomum lignano TaxID=282301 RepID=A0A1I8F3G0_9PLAT